MVGHIYHRSLGGHHPLWNSCDFSQIQSLHQAGNTFCSCHGWLVITGVCEVIIHCGTVVISCKSNHFIKLATHFAPVIDGWPYISQESVRSSLIAEQFTVHATPGGYGWLVSHRRNQKVWRYGSSSLAWHSSGLPHVKLVESCIQHFLHVASQLRREKRKCS